VINVIEVCAGAMLSRYAWHGGVELKQTGYATSGAAYYYRDL